MELVKLGQALISRQRLIFLYKKNRARQRKVEFTISFEDVEFPKFCPVLNVPLEYFGGVSKHSPSFDRINPSMGYVPGNVQIISLLANNMKSNATPEELLKFAKWVGEVYETMGKG
jgi:hypothetical protein